MELSAGSKTLLGDWINSQAFLCHWWPYCCLLHKPMLATWKSSAGQVCTPLQCQQHWWASRRPKVTEKDHIGEGLDWKSSIQKRGGKKPAFIESDVWAPCLQLRPTYSVHHLFKAFLTQKGIFNNTEKNPPEVEAQAPLPWINGIQISHKRLNYTGRIFLPFLNHMWQNLEVIFLTVESYWTEQFSKKYHQGYPSTRIQRISRASLTEGVKLFCNNATDHSLQQTEDTF